MPLYEYKCNACGTVFEVIQRFSDAPLTVHEGCGGSVERLLSAPAFQFKGTGWYITDYARGKNGTSSPSKEHKDARESKETKESKPSTPAKTETSSAANPTPSTK